MNDSTLIQVIKELERTAPVNSLKIDGAHIWPLVRFQLNKKTRRSLHAKTKTGALKILVKILLRFIRNTVSLTTQIRNRRKERLKDNQVLEYDNRFDTLKRSEYLILSQQKEHYQTIQGKVFAPLLDSIRFLSEKSDHQFTKLSIRWKSSASAFYQVENLSPNLFVARENLNSLSNPRSLRRLAQSIATVAWLGLLSIYLKRIAPTYRIDIGELLNLITKLRGQRIFYRNILERVKPKVVILSSYIGKVGLVSAAKEIGIPVIDVQHAGMWKEHPYNANWTTIPEGGYHYLPNYFWCWSEMAAEMVESSCHGSLPDLPRAVVGGHPWLGLCLSSHKEILLTQNERSFLQSLRDDPRKIVLVVLQYGPNSNLADFVINTIKETSAQFKWLLRLHPKGRNLKSGLLTQLNGYVEEKEIDIASSMPLHALLHEVDNIVTNYSTIGTEAMNFSINTTIVSPVGLEVFDHEINEGIYDYAVDEESLKGSLFREKRSNDALDNSMAAKPTTRSDIIQILDRFN